MRVGLLGEGCRTRASPWQRDVRRWQKSSPFSSAHLAKASKYGEQLEQNRTDEEKHAFFSLNNFLMNKILHNV
jgi:hypothetical protein